MNFQTICTYFKNFGTQVYLPKIIGRDINRLLLRLTYEGVLLLTLVQTQAQQSNNWTHHLTVA
jgi:hypothetical protein